MSRVRDPLRLSPPPQVLGTAILVFGVMAISDRRNLNVPKPMLPLGVGIVLYGAIACSGSNTGAALNPARDLGPRIYSYVIGYWQVFRWVQAMVMQVLCPQTHWFGGTEMKFRFKRLLWI